MIPKPQSEASVHMLTLRARRGLRCTAVALKFDSARDMSSTHYCRINATPPPPPTSTQPTLLYNCPVLCRPQTSRVYFTPDKPLTGDDVCVHEV